MSGALKVFYSGWRTKKHAALAEQEQAERLAYSEAWRHRQRQDADTVPFGIKAMQNPMVDAAKDTLAGTSHPSTKDSVQASSEPSKQETTSKLETENKKETLADIKAAVDIALAQNRANTDRPRTPNRVHPAMRHQDEDTRGRSRKADYVPYVLRTSEPQQALQEIDAVYRTPRWFREDSQARSFTDSAYDDQPGTPDLPVDSARVSPQFTKQELAPRSRQPSVDFSLIDKHRQTLAAETGQLTARSNNKKQLTINTGLAASRRARSSPRTPPVDSQAPPRIPQKAEARSQSASRVLSGNRAHINSRLSATESGIAAKAPMHSPTITSFADFVQNTPLSPVYSPAFSSVFSPAERQSVVDILEFAFDPETHLQHQDEPASAVERTPVSALESGHSSAILGGPVSAVEGTANNAVMFELEDTSPRRRPSFEKIRAKRETVIRGHGTGFEILKPGTLQDTDSRPEIHRLRTAPPVSIQNFSRPRPRSSSRGRKLQKRPTSVGSRESSRESNVNNKRFSIIQLWSRRNSVQE